MNYMAEGVRQFMVDNKAANWEASGGAQGDKVQQLKETLAAMPQYQETKAKV
jgi:hypothetical protein